MSDAVDPHKRVKGGFRLGPDFRRTEFAQDGCAQGSGPNMPVLAPCRTVGDSLHIRVASCGGSCIQAGKPLRRLRGLDDKLTLLASPLIGGLTCHLAEQAGKMRLIAKATRGRDLTKRLIAFDHQRLRPLDPTADDVAMGRQSKASPKGFGKIAAAQPHKIGEILGGDPGLEIPVDMADDATHLPGNQPAPSACV